MVFFLYQIDNGKYLICFYLLNLIRIEIVSQLDAFPSNIPIITFVAVFTRNFSSSFNAEKKKRFQNRCKALKFVFDTQGKENISFVLCVLND